MAFYPNRMLIFSESGYFWIITEERFSDSNVGCPAAYTRNRYIILIT